MRRIIFVILIIYLASKSELCANNWEGIYGGAGNEFGYDIIKTSDEGYVIVGVSSSFGDVWYDLWLFKIDSNGEIQWQNRYNSVYNEAIYSIVQISDGGYALVGALDVLSNIEDYWIIKVDNNFNIQWQKAIGKKGDERAVQVIATSDGGFIATGHTDTYGKGLADIWVTKFNLIGQFLSYKTYGTAGSDFGKSIVETDDGGYLVAGITKSYSSGEFDIVLLKLNNEYNIVWQKVYGTAREERANHIIKTLDGGYIICGYIALNALSQRDILLIKLDSAGGIEWARTYFTALNEEAYKIIEKPNGGYVIIGYIEYEGNADDILVISIDNLGNIQWQKRYGGIGYDRAISIIEEEAGFLIMGYTGSYGNGGYDVWIMKLNNEGEIGGECSISSNSELTPQNINLSVEASSLEETIPILYASFTDVSPIQTNANYEVCINIEGAGAVPDNDNYIGNPLKIEKSGYDLKLTWGAPGGNCITDDYNIYKGHLPLLNYDHELVVCSTNGQNEFIINAGSDSYYYIVVAQYQNYEGSYGIDSENIQRPVAINQCNPQIISNCN